MREGRPVGIVTSGGYGFRTRKALALAYLRPGTLSDGLTISILGRELAARELAEALYDPGNLRLRGHHRVEATPFTPA
jgi:dimethylglycine dehydrogenase